MKLTICEWWRAGRQGTLCWIVLGLLVMTFAFTTGAQGVSTTTVQGTVYLANGQAGAGTLVVSWPSFVTASGQAVAADRLTVTIPTDGFVSVNLAPNVGALPAGQYYTAVFYMSDGSVSTQYWQVPAAAQASIAQVKTQVMPAAQAVQAVSKAYVDQSISQLTQSLLTASGGTLSGPLYLSADPTQAMQAATKHYVDTQVSTAVPLAGGNMTGALGTPAVNGVEAPAVGSSQTTLQAAVNAAGTNGAMEIPPSYSGSDTFTNPNGVRVTDLRTQGSQQTERSVKEFGAVCDGVTDDTSALQAALNYANAHGVALTVPEGTCKTRTLNWRGESIGGLGKQVSALMGFPGQDVLASTADATNLMQYTKLHDLTIYVDQSVDVSCTTAKGRAAAGSCQMNRPMESNSIFSAGANGLTNTAGTGTAWAVGNCAIAMPAATGAGGNGLRVAAIENVEIATTGVDPMAAQYPGAHSTHTCGIYVAQWPQWSEFRNIDIRGLNTGIAIPALPVATPAGLNADSNRWQNVTIQATHAFTAGAGSNNVVDNLVALVSNSAATSEPPTGLVLDFAGSQQGWTVRNAVVVPTWNAVAPSLTVTASGGAVTAVGLGTEHGLGWDPYGTSVPLTFSGSCTAHGTATVNSNGSIASASVTQGGVGCSSTTTASLNAAGTWDTAAPVNLISGQSMTFFAGNLEKGNGGYTVWNATGAQSFGTQLSGGGGNLPGGGSYSSLEATSSVGTTLAADQFPGVDFGAKLQACLGAVNTSYGGTCDARNFTGNLQMSTNLTVSKSNTTVLLPCATIATPNQIVVAAGTRNVSLRGCALRGGSASNGSQGGTAFAYSGTGAMVQIGDPTYAVDTPGFHMDNVVINTTGATSGSAKGLVAYRTQEMDLESLYLLGNGNQTGMILDGTGNYTGGTFLDDQLGGFQVAVNAIGHQVTNSATTDWLNASAFVRLHIDCPTSGGSPVSGTIGINLQQGDGNTFTGGDVEGCSTALHLGANAQNNTIVGLRNENSTSQVVADAGSAYNNWMTGGTMFTGQLTDNGTRNSFLDTFHRSFNGLNGDWYGSQQDATLTNHFRLGIGSGNERGLLNRYQTDFGYRWTTGLSDATGGEQFYQILDELNNVYRFQIGQYNNGQASTNNQTVINSAGTGAIVLNGSTNAGTGGIVIGSGGTSSSTVATINNAGNAQFNGTLQVSGTTQSTGTMTVRNGADSEVDYYLWPGLTASQKGAFTYKDWNGNSQWYLVKDASNNWAVNSAVGGLDSFKAYQSSNSGDTYLNASNSTGHIRLNYESGSGTETDIYSGSSSNLVAAFLGTTSIKFPGLAATSGHYCLQIDNSGYITNTGSACGSGGGGSGTVGSGTAGAIAYYSAAGTTIAGESTVPVTAGGTGAATASAALANLGGVASSGGTLTGALTAPQFNGPLAGNVTGNVSGTAANVTGTVALANGGTGATTAAGAIANLLPGVTTNGANGISVAGNAQLNGTLQVGGTTSFSGTTTVTNQANAEIDSVLQAGSSASQKESFLYRDWNGSNQWYLAKDTSNNWAVNSAIGGLDSFKAYQSTNSGDTYVNASNTAGHIRLNYESGSGAETDIYSGSNSSLAAAFLGPTSIKFPGLAAGSGHYCLQIDNSGYITNTGTACGTGTGGGSGTVNSGTTGSIAYYTTNGTVVGGESTVPLTAGGTGAATAAAAVSNLLPGVASDGHNGITVSGMVTAGTVAAKVNGGVEYASQYQTNGQDGIANASSGAANQTVIADPSYGTMEQPSQSSFAATPFHFEDQRLGTTTDFYHNPGYDLTSGLFGGNNPPAGEFIDCQFDKTPATGFSSLVETNCENALFDSITPGWSIGPASVGPGGWQDTIARQLNINVNGAGITQGDSIAVNKYAPGDNIGEYITTNGFGGATAGADEGTKALSLATNESAIVYTGPITSGGSTGSTLIKTTSSSPSTGSQGTGQYLIDKTAGATATTFTNITAGIQTGISAVTVGATVPVSTAWGTLATDVATPLASSAPYTTSETFSINIVMGTFNTSAPMCFTSQQHEQTIPTSVVAPSSGVQSVTANLHGAHAAGTYVFQGGMCGYGMEATAYTETVGGTALRYLFDVVGSTDAHTLQATLYKLGALYAPPIPSTSYKSANIASTITNSGTTVSFTDLQTGSLYPNLYLFNGRSITLAGFSDSAFNTTCTNVQFAINATSGTCTIAGLSTVHTSTTPGTAQLTGLNAVNLWPMAQVLDVENQATTPPSLDGTLAVEPNSIAFANGDMVEITHGTAGEFTGFVEDANVRNPFAMFSGAQIAVAGAAAQGGGGSGASTAIIDVANANLDTMYLGYGGYFNPPNLMNISGGYNIGLNFTEGPGWGQAAMLVQPTSIQDNDPNYSYNMFSGYNSSGTSLWKINPNTGNMQIATNGTTAFYSTGYNFNNGVVNGQKGFQVNGSAGTSGQALCSNGTAYLNACSFVPASTNFYYQTVAANGTSQAQRPTLNFSSQLSVTDSISPAETTVGIANSGVSAGSYTNASITVSADGRVTAASNGASTSFAPIVNNTAGDTLCSMAGDTTVGQVSLTAVSSTSSSMTYTMGYRYAYLYVGQVVSVQGNTTTGYNAAPLTITAVTYNTVTVSSTNNPGVGTAGGTMSLYCRNQTTDAAGSGGNNPGTTAFQTVWSVPANTLASGGHLSPKIKMLLFSNGAGYANSGVGIFLGYGAGFPGNTLYYSSPIPNVSAGNTNGPSSMAVDFDISAISSSMQDTQVVGFTAPAYGGYPYFQSMTNANGTGGLTTYTTSSAANLTPGIWFKPTGVASGTYTSGGTITGTTGQTCTLTSFNNSSTATATVALTGTNTIGGGTALTITARGFNASAAPTTATLGSGTATCSGTATIATVLGGSPSYAVLLQDLVIAP